MPTLKYLQGRGAKINATSTPDFSALTLFFDDLISVNDANDPGNMIESASADIEVDIQIDQPETLIFDFRGSILVSNPACWGLVSANAKGQRMIIHSSEQDGEFNRQMMIELKESGPLWLSVLLLSQRDPADLTSSANTQCDSLDLRFAGEGDS